MQLNEAYDVLKDPQKRAAYDAARQGHFQPGASPGSTTGAGRPAQTRRGVFGTFRSIFVLLLLLATLPYALRLFKSPKALVVIAVAIALAWFGPRIIGYFKK